MAKKVHRILLESLAFCAVLQATMFWVMGTSGSETGLKQAQTTLLILSLIIFAMLGAGIVCQVIIRLQTKRIKS